MKRKFSTVRLDRPLVSDETMAELTAAAAEWRAMKAWALANPHRLHSLPDSVVADIMADVTSVGDA